MHKDIENGVPSPFKDKRDLENFFMGGGRAEVLDQLRESIVSGVPLLGMTGEAGSGKTMICRMLKQTVAEECVVVNFHHTVESFEDVVRVIAGKLGVPPAGTADGGGVKDTIEKIVALLLENRAHLLLIFDEAENIYLATLERIRKILGQMTESGIYLHVLFSGRPSFLENYEQLVICDFKQIEEVHLVLEPLSEVETVNYLENCIDRLPNSADRDLFTEEVILEICTAAQGNFGMINALAEESIANPGDKPFMALLDSVAEEKEEEEGIEWPQVMAEIRRFIPSIQWLGGAVAVVVLIFLVFDFGEKDELETVAPLKHAGEKKIEIVIEKKKNIKPEPEVKNTVTAVVIPTVEAEVSESSAVESISEPEIISQEKTEPVSVVEEIAEPEAAKLETAKAVDKITEAAKPEIVQPEVAKPKVEAVRETVAVDKMAEQKPLQREDVIVELRPSPSLKKKVDVMKPIRKRKLLRQPSSKVQKNNLTAGYLTVDQLYSRRMAAGKTWEHGARDNMYTIQLMVLTSKNAEENLKKMLAQKNYRQQAENFYIFRKNSSPLELLVYYGEYPTIAEARRVQKSVPVFLQKHKPYAISIKGALAKVVK